MKHNRILFVILWSVLLVISMYFIGSKKSWNQSFISPAQAVQGPETTFQVHLPFLSQPANSFGLETWYYGPNNQDTQYAIDTGAKWIRRNGIFWSDIEPSEGMRDWSGEFTMKLEGEIINAANLGKKMILIVRSTPGWAQVVAGSGCGPMQEAKFEAFGNFMADVVARYSRDPYNVEYYEIWNEPDAALNVSFSTYGCWGSNSSLNWQSNDPYYGGRYYGKMLKVVYPKVKAANPRAKVVVAGFLLDCDPVNPPIDPKTGKVKDCTPAKFLEGILVEGAVHYFDVVSIHAYDYFQGSLGNYSNFNWHSAYNTTGPVLIAKTNYVRNLLASYTSDEKEIFLSEIALVCSSNCNDTFQRTKANYIPQAYVTAITEGVSSSVWYHLFNIWNNSGLINNDVNPYAKFPAYPAYQFAQRELSGASEGKNISQSGLWIYEIYTMKGTVWVAWSKDGLSHNLTLALVPRAAYDVQGNSIPVSKNMTITINPIYIEITLP
jgi:hypothetical protein